MIKLSASTYSLLKIKTYSCVQINLHAHCCRECNLPVFSTPIMRTPFVFSLYNFGLRTACFRCSFSPMLCPCMFSFLYSQRKQVAFLCHSYSHTVSDIPVPLVLLQRSTLLCILSLTSSHYLVIILVV